MAYTNFTNCTEQEYMDIIYSEEDKNRIRIWFNDVELEDADEYCESFFGTNRILPSDGNKIFTLDNFVAKEYELVLKGLPETTVIADQVKVSIGTLVDEANNTYEDVPIGIFNIQDNPETDQDRITIKLRDNRVKFDFNYNAQSLIEANGGTATKKQILQDICNQAGVVNKVLVFDGQDDEIGIYDNSITATTYISYIFEQAGLMPTINRNGELDKILFEDLKVWRIPLSKIENYEKGTPFEVQRVVYESGVIKFETSSDESLQTLYLNAANPYITNEEQVENIYNMLNCFTIDSVKTGKILGNPAIDPFDIIEVYDDEISDSPITTQTSTPSQWNINFENTNEGKLGIKLEPYIIFQGETPTITEPTTISTTNGKTEITVYGDNFFDGEFEIGGISAGQLTNSTITIRTKNYQSIEPSAEYIMEVPNEVTYVRLFYYNNDVYVQGDIVEYPSAHKIKFTTNENANQLKWTYNQNYTTLENQTRLMPAKTEIINMGMNRLYIADKEETTINGIKYSVQDGVITLKGTASAATTIWFDSDLDVLNQLAHGQATLTRIIQDGSWNFEFDIGDANVHYYWQITSSSTSTTASQTKYPLNPITQRPHVYISSGTNVDCSFVVQCVKGVFTQYYPYFEPIEYCAIGDTKDEFIKTTGKNMADISQIKIGKQWNNTDSSNYASILYIPLEKQQQYTLAGFWGNSRTQSVRGYLNNGPEDTTNYETITVSSTTPNITFNSGNWSYISITAYVSGTPFQKLHLHGLNIMLCKGEATIDDYEPYGMNKWYIKKKVGSVVLDGTEPSGTFATNNIYRVFSYDLPCRLATTSASNLDAKSDYFPNLTVTYNENCFLVSSTYIRVRFNTSFTDLASIQTWLAEHRPRFYGRLYKDYYYPLPDLLQQQLDNIYKTFKSYNGNTTIEQVFTANTRPFIIQASVYNDSFIFGTLANNTYKYNGVNTNTFDTQIGLEQRTENVSLNGEATLKKWAKTSIDNLQGQITMSAGEINDLEGRVDSAEFTLEKTGAKLDVLSTNIDEETGNVLGVKTTSYELGSNGFIIDDGTGYKSVDNTTGKYFYDNNSMVGKYTKDGSVQKNLALFGKYYYGVDENVNVADFSKENAMFVAQVYTGKNMQGNDETGFGHFYNGN